MGCLCSAPDRIVTKAGDIVPVAEVNCQTVYEPTFSLSAPKQDGVPLLNAVSPANITVSDSDTSDVDQEMIKNLLEQVKIASDED